MQFDNKAEIEHNDIEKVHTQHSADLEGGKDIEGRVELSEEDVSTTCDRERMS
jgi:hypothetical protein